MDFYDLLILFSAAKRNNHIRNKMTLKALAHQGLPELLAMLNDLGILKADIVCFDHDATSGTYFCVYQSGAP
jgi:hypothetical protein